MNLRRKIFLTTTVTLVVAAITVYTAFFEIVTTNFAQVEQESLRRDVARVTNALEVSRTGLARSVSDWSVWDDTYDFVHDLNEAYIQSNLNLEVMANLNVNFMLYFDTAQNLVYGQGYDLQAREPTGIPEQLRQFLHDAATFLPPLKRREPHTGLLMLPQGPLLLALHPILSDTTNGASRGTMLMARYLNDAEVAELSRTTELRLTLYALDEPSTPEHVQMFGKTLSELRPDEVLIHEASAGTIAGYTILRDLFSRPVLILGVETSRPIYAQGQKTIQHILLVLLTLGVVFAAIHWAFLDVAVLSRIAHLNRSVRAISRASSPSKRIALRGSDEMAALASEINRMLEALEQSQARFRENQEQFRLIFELSPVGMALVSLSTSLIQVNKAFCEMLGASPKELRDRSIVDFLGLDAHENVFRQQELLTGEVPHLQVERSVSRRDGTVAHLLLQVTMMRNASGEPEHYICQIMDLSEKQRHQDQIEHMAYYDSLTGLANRQRLREEIEALLARKPREAAVLFLDLDHFKMVNDTLGHDVGDELLVLVAQRLLEALRRDEVFARLGGDEFAILLADVTKDDVTEVARRISTRLAEPFVLRGQPVHVGGSIGIACYPQDGLTMEQLLKHADIAMYQAKTEGGDYRYYHPDINTYTEKRLRMGAELLQALKSGRLAVQYQPLFDLHTGSMTAVEALVRWPHAQEAIPPQEFIAIAENSGFIAELDLWVFRQAVSRLVAWQYEGLELSLHVNISPRTLGAVDLMDRMLACLNMYAVAPERIILEVTENAVLQQPDAAIKVLNDLKRAGLRVAVDDFGSGYASLSYLKLLPLDLLKIDKSLIGGLEQNARDEGLVQAAITLGHSLGLEVLGEGVEEERQREWLRARGCNFAQGYLLSEPVSANEVIKLAMRKPALREGFTEVDSSSLV